MSANIYGTINTIIFYQLLEGYKNGFFNKNTPLLYFFAVNNLPKVKPITS